MEKSQKVESESGCNISLTTSLRLSEYPRALLSAYRYFPEVEDSMSAIYMLNRMGDRAELLGKAIRDLPLPAAWAVRSDEKEWSILYKHDKSNLPQIWNHL